MSPKTCLKPAKSYQDLRKENIIFITFLAKCLAVLYIYHISCVIVGKVCFIISPNCKNSVWFFSHLMYSFKSYMLYNILFQFCLTYSGVSGLSASNLRRFCSHDDRFHRPLITDAELRDLILGQIICKSSMNLWYFHTLSKYSTLKFLLAEF